ncbi:hypothetical protein Q5P01_025739 [Channa striata]|uniref:Uncharacterized protein n=1 Tax=Channa striata TaxID=64152 RepID=A0AA88IXD8_CHASR|nr:hypothetical protein Q5P01_025739 [Channa striata]
MLHIFLSLRRLQAVEEQQQQQSGHWLPKMELSQLPGWIRNWILFHSVIPLDQILFPPRVLGEEWGGPASGHTCPTPPPLKKRAFASGQQLQPAGGPSLRIGQGLVHATPAYLSSQDATPGRAYAQLDDNTAD